MQPLQGGWHSEARWVKQTRPEKQGTNTTAVTVAAIRDERSKLFQRSHKELPPSLPHSPPPALLLLYNTAPAFGCERRVMCIYAYDVHAQLLLLRQKGSRLLYRHGPSNP